MEDLRVYKPVAVYVLDVSVFSRLRQLVEKHQLPADRLEEFLDLRDAVVRGNLEITGVEELIRAAFGLEEAKSKEVTADFLGMVLLPLKLYLPTVVAEISHLGGDVTHYETKVVEKEQISPDEFVRHMVQKWGMNLSEHLLRRLIYLATSYLTKARTKESILHTLGRPVSVGGMELDAAVSEKFLDALDKEGKKFALDVSDVSDLETEAPVVEPSLDSRLPARAADDPAYVFKVGGPTTLQRRQPGVLTKREADRYKSTLSGANQSVQIGRTDVHVASDVPLERSKAAVWNQFMALFSSRDTAPAPDVQLPVDDEDLSWDSLFAALDVPSNWRDVPIDRGAVNQTVDAGDSLESIHATFLNKGLSEVAYKDLTIGFLHEGRSKGKTRQILEHVHGFSKEEAGDILAKLSKERTRMMSGPDVAVEIKAKKTPVQFDRPLSVRSPAQSLERVSVVAAKDASMMLGPEEEKEVLAEKRKMQRRAVAPAATSIETTVEEVYRSTSEIFNKYTVEEKQARDVIASVVRGTRELHQAERYLIDKFSFTHEDAARVVLAAKRASVHQMPVKAVPEVKKDFDTAERQVLDQRFSALTKSRSTESVEPVLPHASVSAARTKEEELKLQGGSVSSQALVEAEVSARPKKAKAFVSAGSAAPVHKESGGKVTDVSYVKKLVGPVEELGTMTVSEFRRLSSDPKEAGRKILDKLMLLQATAYEQRIAGVAGWRKSPVNRLYLDMARESLTAGRSFAEIATDRRNEGKESLSPAEVQAIVELNKKMKF